MKTHKTLLLSITIALSLSANIHATNGYFPHGYGVKSKSMAGTCVAMTLDASCAITNPASLVAVGSRLDYGFALFMPSRGFAAHDDASSIGPPTGFASIPSQYYESDNDRFIIPHWSYSRSLDEYNAIGLFVSGHGGMNTEYNRAVFRNFSNPMDSSTQPSLTTGMDLVQAFMGVTYARKITEQHFLGITPIMAIQTFEAQGLQPFKPFSAHPDQITNNGHDISYGGGIRVGWLGQITNYFTLGASYQTKLWMTPFDDYKGLLAEAGDFDIPANYSLGFALKVIPKLTLAFDYQRIEYGSIKTLSNNSNLVFTPGKTLLGTDNGLGFGWEDMDIFKIGVQWDYNPNLTLRAGYSHASNPFPNTQALFNTLAPAVIRKHYTFGFSIPLSQKVEFNVAFMYAPNEKIYGMNENTGPQTGFIEMEQFEIEVGWGIVF